MWYKPVFLIFRDYCDLDVVSSPAHALSRRVLTQQGEGGRLPLPGSVEICKINTVLTFMADAVPSLPRPHTVLLFLIEQRAVCFLCTVVSLFPFLSLPVLSPSAMSLFTALCQRAVLPYLFLEGHTWLDRPLWY